LRPWWQAARAEHEQEIGNRALLDHQGSIHVGFAELELGVEQDSELGAAVGKPDGNFGTVAADDKDIPTRGGDPQLPTLDELSKCDPKQPFHGRLHPHRRHAGDIILVFTGASDSNVTGGEPTRF
jgi:hypothetical protein